MQLKNKKVSISRFELILHDIDNLKIRKYLYFSSFSLLLLINFVRAVLQKKYLKPRCSLVKNINHLRVISE